MTDDTLEQRVQGIIQKLDTLHLSQEYGQLLKDLYGKVQAMEGEIAKLKLVPPPPAKEFKPGRLGVKLHHPYYHYSRLDGLEVMVSNGDQNYYGTTGRGYGKAFYSGFVKADGTDSDPVYGYCEFTELPGGTYEVKVRYERNTFGLNVTIDGDTCAELKLGRSNETKKKFLSSDEDKIEKSPFSPLPAPQKRWNSRTKKALIVSLVAAVLAGTAITYAAVRYFNRNTLSETLNPQTGTASTTPPQKTLDPQTEAGNYTIIRIE